MIELVPGGGITIETLSVGILVAGVLALYVIHRLTSKD